MIINRLGILMAERGIKISDVFEATNISRSTLTSISQNESKMIQLETIDSLCNYFDITPNEFFDYAPYILKYDSYIPDYREEAIEDLKKFQSKLEDYGHNEDRILQFTHDYLNIFGDSRKVIEISVKKVQKNYNYLMGIDIFQSKDLDDSNAPKEFDVIVTLTDSYNLKNFTEDIYNNVSVTFQTKIKNDCMNLVEGNIKELENFASISKRKISVYIETPFGDKSLVISPNKKTKEEITKEYNEILIEWWEKSL
ncbi:MULTISPECIES: helix-turn-helix transcriptional regulator [Vagococcus]|uniref:Phage protein n=1 Tax=Vagococcus fluvialis bH819 TaxID=1255619 RepID=A0A1X6WQG5_9ENTE|nr:MULTISPECIES: helix-turn-helix transcriptional regulator [Vagococcus]SLM86544.1 Phage protein [Vagococcus fluvialis bH819]HCM90751.1 XRE family transcriptional regulator [Vagococcus sp.]